MSKALAASLAEYSAKVAYILGGGVETASDKTAHDKRAQRQNSALLYNAENRVLRLRRAVSSLCCFVVCCFVVSLFCRSAVLSFGAFLLRAVLPLCCFVACCAITCCFDVVLYCRCCFVPCCSVGIPILAIRRYHIPCAPPAGRC